jgi:hypothetical protein
MVLEDLFVEPNSIQGLEASIVELVPNADATGSSLLLKSATTSKWNVYVYKGFEMAILLVASPLGTSISMVTA